MCFEESSLEKKLCAVCSLDKISVVCSFLPLYFSQKTSQDVKQDEEKRVFSKNLLLTSVSRSQENHTNGKVEELSRMDSVDGFQNAFKVRIAF